MTAVQPSGESLRELLNAACNDTLTDDQFDRLEAALAESEDARREYLRYFTLGGELRYLVSMAQADATARRRTDAEYDAAVLLQGTDSFVPPPISPLPTAATGLSQDWARAYVFAAVVLGLFLMVASWLNVTHFAGPNRSGQVADADSRPSPMEFVGKISGMKDCRWSDPETSAIIGASVALDREYALASGLLEITYKSGARVILEGPCRYKVDSNAGGYLAVGKLTARVETKGSGFGVRGSEARGQKSHPSSLIPHPSSLFSIHTPTALVTDLGTEFGVEVAANGDTVSYVFQGSIKVQGLSASPDSGAAQEEKVLRVNESIRVSRVRETHHEQTANETVRFTHPTHTPSFVREMPLLGSAGSDTYAELVLSFHPAVYYRMERPRGEKDNLTVADSADGGHHGELILSNDSYDPYRRGRWGKALLFRGPSSIDAVLVPDYPKATDGKLTVAAWVTAEPWMRRWPKIAANWGSKARGQFNIGLYEEDDDLVVRVMQSDGTRITVREGQSFPLSQWQHVAFVADGTMLRLYRNGEEVAKTECVGLFADPPISSLSIGFKAGDDGKSVYSKDRFWRGMIDELAIFNSALTPEEIRSLYEAKPLSTIKSNAKGGK